MVRGAAAAALAGFEQAAELVTREACADNGAFGPDVAEHVEAFRPFVDADFDEVYVANMGPHHQAMIEFYGREILPKL